MRLRLLVAGMLALGLVLGSTPALAKGANEMTLAGPGLPSPIRLANTADALMSPNTVAQKSGLFSREPDRRTTTRPPGDLGPRYVATYAWFIGQDHTTPLRQDLYPFADGGALTYTPPVQGVHAMRPSGGWYRAGAELTQILVLAGVPLPESYAAPPAVVAEPQSTG
jgi:hypothetical protein